MKVFLSVWVCLSLLVAVLADWEDGNDGIDRPYGDLPNQPTVMDANAQPKDCAALCKANSACKVWAYIKPNCEGPKVPWCYQKENITTQLRNKCVVSGLGGQPGLVPLKYIPFPVGAIRPEGWLLDVLRTQANGLSGHLDDFWPFVNQSVWVGGSSDPGLHEDTPYWLNGFLPLAYQLNDDSLKMSVERYVKYILDYQTDDGWLGPEDNPKDGNRYWGRYNVMNILRQYHEANPQDTRAIPTMLKFLKQMYSLLFDVPLGSGSWSGARWQDLVTSIHWLLDNKLSNEEQMLWDFADLLHQQGFKWSDWYGSTGGMTFPTDAVSGATMYTHGVNNGMAIKSAAVWSRQSHNQSDVKAAYQCVKVLDQYHGQANGIFSCDEHLAGLMPSRGTELCTVVESMYSYETMFNILGDQMFSERAELLAYNALPATLTPDMWAHQYLQQVNQIQAISLTDHIWTHDGPDSTVYGLAPNYVCCTANFNQGWPKFTQHIMSQLANGEGVAISMYTPANLSFTLPNGVSTTVVVKTDYPFTGDINITASCGQGMTLSLRIPSWAVGPSVVVNQSTSNPSGDPKPGNMYDVKCSGRTNVSLTFPRTITVQRRFNDAAAVYYGPLLFALEVQDKDVVTHTYYKDSKDYSMTAVTPWNYALYLPSGSSPEKVMNVTFKGVTNGVSPFSLTKSPLMISAQGKKLDSWGIVHNAADAPPKSPVQSSQPMETITLLPYGATNLRMGELPVLDQQ